MQASKVKEVIGIGRGYCARIMHEHVNVCVDDTILVSSDACCHSLGVSNECLRVCHAAVHCVQVQEHGVLASSLLLLAESHAARAEQDRIRLRYALSWQTVVAKPSLN